MSKRIILGATYTDRITGLTGVATGYVEYISGCNQGLIIPKAEGNKPSEGVWFDVQRLEPVEAKVITLDNGTSPGCDMAAPIR